ncbi:MAG: diguanylate cyclase [Candidatus Omnitrophica bacterium]|nr:diguanylate cyclase [Candidatus Omnitrophota bacterium]
MENMKSILIVDDDKLLSDSLKLVLAEEGYHAVVAHSGEAAVEAAKKEGFNVMVLDLMLPDMSGIELLRMFNKKYPETGFIICTGFASLPTAIEALKAAAYDYIIKPFNVDHFKLVIERCINKQELIANNKYLFERLEREKYKLEIILDVYNEIAAIYDLDDLADMVTGKAVQLLEAEKASLMLIDDESKELVLKSAKGLGKEKVSLRTKVGELISGWVAQQGEVLLVRDIDEDPRFRSYPKNKRYKTRSFISVPLKVEKKVIGVLNVTDKLSAAKIFNEEDIRYLSLIAYHTVAQIENIRLCERLASIAVTDPLTGMFNHRYFQEQISLEIMRSQRYGHTLSLIMFDIDHFKEINDKNGHLAGDRVLKQAANIMRDNIRHVDILCRYGGDEFVIILPNTDMEGSLVVAEKIRKTVEEQEIKIEEEGKEKSLKVTVSGGVAGYRDGLSKADFLNRVDATLYKSKVGGRNMVTGYK